MVFYKQLTFKAWIRSAAISCINTWGDQCGYKEFFDGEVIGDALKSGSPTLRNEMWIWLTDKLGGSKYIITLVYW